MTKIVIIGGGVFGSGLAWNLAKGGAADDVVVIEPDPTYEFGGNAPRIWRIRYVQGLRENLLMSLYGRDIYNFSNTVDTRRPVELGFHECGYIFLGQRTQRPSSKPIIGCWSRTAHVELLDRAGLEKLIRLSISTKPIGASIRRRSDRPSRGPSGVSPGGRPSWYQLSKGSRRRHRRRRQDGKARSPRKR